MALVLAGGAAYYFTKNRMISESLMPKIQEQTLPESQEIYENGKYGFSFGYPKEIIVLEFTESNRDIILARDVTASGVFQISVSSFDESGPITKERILKDISNMRISNDKEISVGGEKALSFISQDASLETFEIWFARSGNLYQISALSNFGGELDKILATWKFQ